MYPEAQEHDEGDPRCKILEVTSSFRNFTASLHCVVHERTLKTTRDHAKLARPALRTDENFDEMKSREVRGGGKISETYTHQTPASPRAHRLATCAADRACTTCARGAGNQDECVD